MRVEEQTRKEIVAGLLVDHLVSFKGCDYHDSIDEYEYGMKAFSFERGQLLIPNPDFAEDEYLPAEARLVESDGPDKGKKPMTNQLSSTERELWPKVATALQQALAGENEDGQITRFHYGAGDLVNHRSQRIRQMARGHVTVDIDSVNTLFTDLSMINCTIDVSVVSSPWRNLKSSINIAYKGISLHRIPHFFLG